MKILIIPDSFKGSLGAFDVAKAIEKGIRSVLPDVICKTTGFADGGEGSLELWLSLGNGEFHEITVNNPYGKPIKAAFGWETESSTAFIEVAQASGMAGFYAGELNPLRASSYGTGQIIKHAIELGAQNIIMALGGSATIDGATGLLQALGVQFKDEDGCLILHGGNPLIEFQSVEFGKFRELKRINWLLLSDVNNPLSGQNGAARVFGPQKGATDEMVEILDNRLVYWHSQLLKNKGKHISEIPGSGAAGGMGVPFLAFLDANIDLGFNWYSKKMNLQALISNYDIVITGEGHIDSQTMMGKGPGKIAQMAKQLGCVVIAVTGKAESDTGIFDAVFQLTNENTSTELAMQNVEKLLVKAGAECACFIVV